MRAGTRRGVVILVLLAGAACAGEERPDAPPVADTATAAAATPATPEQQQDGASAGVDAQLRAALEQLVRGDASLADSASSWFSAATAEAIRAVSVDSAGHAVVDFHDLRTMIPNASSSAGSTALLEELNAAVFSVPAIASVEYRMNGSCDLFWEWLQYGCRTVMRGEGG